MLSIFYGDMPEAVYNPVLYFKNTYTDEWITDDLPRNMIRDVDRSTVLGPRIIDSPVLGGISPRELSGGVKTLIAIYKVPEQMDSEDWRTAGCDDQSASSDGLWRGKVYGQGFEHRSDRPQYGRIAADCRNACTIGSSMCRLFEGK